MREGSANMNVAGLNTYAMVYSVSSSDTNYAAGTTTPSTMNAYVIRESIASVLIYGEMAFQENQGGGYYIVLTYAPKDDVVIKLTTTGTTITFSPAILTFTEYNYNKPQFITLATVIGNTLRGLKYYITIVHTVVSLDSNYNGLTPSPSSSIKVTAVSPCRAGMYS